MKELLGLIAAVVVALSATVALAGEITGKVSAVDTSERQFILKNGPVLRVAEGVSLEGLKPGTVVSVTYETQDGEPIATEVTRTE